MELNTAKCPFVWDWESLVMLPSKAVEEPKKFNMLDSVFQALDGSEVGSLHSYGGKSDCGSVSDLAYGSSSKSSKSAASVDSSSNRETREPPKFSLEISDCSHATMEPADPWPPTTTSATTAAAVCRSSPMAGVSSKSNVMLMGLKLGKRTYFEDFSASSNSGTRPSGSFCGSSNGTGMMKRSSKLSSIEIPHCQVDGCNLDLSSAKDYHRKHRVCETHSKSSKVVICGLERRFCQQCSRFHGLSEFDQKKRSCRRRLSNHNARRRKPKPEIIQFNSLHLPPSLRTNLAFNQVPVVHIGRANTNLTWDFTSNSKYTQEDEEMGLLEQPDECGFKHSYASSPLLQTSASNMQVFHPDLQQVSGSTTPAHPSSSNNITEAANQTQEDLRALSLLSSNNSWGVASCDPHQEQPPSLRPHQNQSQQQHRFDQRGGSGTTTTSSILHCTSGPTSAPVIPLSLPTPHSVSAVNYWQINELQTTPSFLKDVSSNYDHRYPLSKATNGHGFFLY